MYCVRQLVYVILPPISFLQQNTQEIDMDKVELNELLSSPERFSGRCRLRS